MRRTTPRYGKLRSWVVFVLLAGGAIYFFMRVGAIGYEKNNDKVHITIDTTKVEKATGEVIQKGKELGSKALETTSQVLDNASKNADAPPRR